MKSADLRAMLRELPGMLREVPATFAYLPRLVVDPEERREFWRTMPIRLWIIRQAGTRRSAGE